MAQGRGAGRCPMGVRIVSLSAVSDSGPFIHLHQIGLFDLLTLFDRLVTSKQVMAEIMRPERVAEDCISNLVNRGLPCRFGKHHRYEKTISRV